MSTENNNVFDIKIKSKIAAQMLSGTPNFIQKYKNLVESGSTWLMVRHTTNRMERSEGFINGFASNLIQIEETQHGLIFSKFKALDIHPSDKLELDIVSGVTFSSYGMLYDSIEQAFEILCKNEFDGEVK